MDYIVALVFGAQPNDLLYNGGSDRRGTHFDSNEPLMSRTQTPSLAWPNTSSLFAEGFQTTGHLS
jgi:hypothetical protein